MVDLMIATTLSETLALNYIKEKASFIATSACIGGAAYVAVKLVDEHIKKKK
jgi:hypothetical protein